MDTRIVKTHFYRGDEFHSLTKDGKILAVFLIENEYIGLTPIYKISDRDIKHQTGLTQEELNNAREDIKKASIYFYKGYCILLNDWAYVDYKGGKTYDAKMKEVDSLPQELKSLLEGRATIGQLLGIEASIIHNTEIINHKTENINSKLLNHNLEFVNNNERELLREKTIVDRLRERSLMDTSGFASLDRTFFTIAIFLLFLFGVVFFPKPYVAHHSVISKVSAHSEMSKLRRVGVENKKEATPLASQQTGGTVTALAGGVVSPVGTTEDMIRSIFGADADIAIAIAKAESGLRCSAISPQNKNGTRDHGVFQINDIHMAKFGQNSPYDCVENIKVAYKIFKSWEGWHAWSVYNNKRYLTFFKK
jgi:hypothetical protein